MNGTQGQLALVPLGAGDLIDRAVRLDRRHFTTLIRIAAPPVLTQTLASLIITLGAHMARYDATALLLVLVGYLVWIVGALLNFIVMGGAARNLITHLLWNEPFSARTTYRNVRERFGGLLGSSIIVGFWIGLSFIVAIIAWAFIIQIFIF